MGYRIYDFSKREGSAPVEELKHSAMKAKAAVAELCEIAEQMEDLYSERSYGRREGGYSERGGSYGARGSYGHREYEEDPAYAERRDSRGRFM